MFSRVVSLEGFLKLTSKQLFLIRKWQISSCRKLLLLFHCSSFYCFRARGIVLLYSQRVASQSYETFRELLRDPHMVLKIGGRESLFYFFPRSPI